jgi:hypothetical protein
MRRTALKKTTDSPPAARDPTRAKLAQAIDRHAEIVAAVSENAASQHRADRSKWEALAAVRKAEGAIEEAKLIDARAVAKGGPRGAVKAARIALQDAEDAAEAATTAVTVAADGAKELESKRDLAKMALDRALAEVVRDDPLIPKLFDEFREAKQRLIDIRDSLQELGRAMTPLNPAPRQLQTLDDISWFVHHEKGDASPVAEKLRGWIERLRTDPDAEIG